MYLKEQLKGDFVGLLNLKTTRYCMLINKNMSFSNLAPHKVLIYYLSDHQQTRISA